MTLKFVTQRNALGAKDGIGWDAVAPVGSACPWDNALHGVQCTSGNGTAMLITSPGPNVLRVSRQGLDADGDWAGNFTDGDVLLNGTGSTLPLVVNFARPVSGAGAQIQPADIIGTFNGKLTVFRLVGGKPVSQEFPFGGTSSNANDGTAFFAGVRSTLADVSRIEFQATDVQNRRLASAINFLSLRT